MTTPSSGQNTLVQLNMGEGKSSVIMPMVAAALSDGNQLVRVVVLKSLARQMFSLLLQRLSGLAERQILYLPFSRSCDWYHGHSWAHGLYAAMDGKVRSDGTFYVRMKLTCCRIKNPVLKT